MASKRKNFDRKREPLLTNEEKELRNRKPPVSTAPAIGGKGIPLIPPRDSEVRKSGNER